MEEELKDLQARVAALESADDSSLSPFRKTGGGNSQLAGTDTLSSCVQETLKTHDSWMEDVSNTLQQMQEKDESLNEDIILLKRELNTKSRSPSKDSIAIQLLDAKVDNVVWKKANDELDLAVKTVRDLVSSCRRDADTRRRKVDEVLATLRHDITAVETNLGKSKVKIISDTEQSVKALNGRIDVTNKDLVTTQETLHTTQKSLSDCFNEVAVVRCDLKRNLSDAEARLKNEIRSKQLEVFEKMGVVEQQADLRSAEASRHLASLDARMSGVTKSNSENKRDILKLRDEVNGLTVKCAAYDIDIEKSSDVVRKIENQFNIDEQNWKEQMDAIHSILDTKVNEKPFNDLRHSTASLTKGVVKVAQVVGVFPGLSFDDADSGDQNEVDVELLGWEDCAENMSFRVDKAWRQRFPQRFNNILDMLASNAAKKADHSVLRLDVAPRTSKAQRERKVWKEVVERRCNSAVSMNDAAHAHGATLPAMPQSARGDPLNSTIRLGDQPAHSVTLKVGELALSINEQPSHSVTLPAMPQSARG